MEKARFPVFSDDDTLLTSQATLEIASRASCKDDVLDRSAAKTHKLNGI